MEQILMNAMQIPMLLMKASSVFAELGKILVNGLILASNLWTIYSILNGSFASKLEEAIEMIMNKIANKLQG